jgi:pimeloyl-ACP methyl ester carboxylesterase
MVGAMSRLTASALIAIVALAGAGAESLRPSPLVERLSSGVAAPYLAAIERDELELGRYPASRDRFFEPEGAPRACALLLHGLNGDPRAMDSLARELAAQGVLVYRAALAGHGGPGKTFAAASRERWLGDARLAWRIVEACAAELKIPTIAAGFSLGGLVLVDLESSDPSVRPDGFILLAPATVLRPRVMFFRPLAALGLTVPSLGPAAYRSAPALPAKAYRALFASIDAVKVNPIPADRPSLILVDPKDALVDARALKAEAERAPGCRFVEIAAKSRVWGTQHHLIVAPETVGKAAWATIADAIGSFAETIAGYKREKT